MLDSETLTFLPAWKTTKDAQWERFQGAIPGLQLVKSGDFQSDYMLVCSIDETEDAPGFYEGVIIGQLPQVMTEATGPRSRIGGKAARRPVPEHRKPMHKRAIDLSDEEMTEMIGAVGGRAEAPSTCRSWRPSTAGTADRGQLAAERRVGAMPDTLTPNIKITNQTEGGNDNTWGTIADANFEEIDDKFGDVTSVSTTGGTTVLTDAQEIVNAIHVSGTLVSNVTITFSGRGGTWIVKNSTTEDFTVTCKVSGQTGVVVTQDTTTIVYCNGTDIANTGSFALVNDTDPALGGILDTNGFDIEFQDDTGIADDDGNEQLIFQKTASAINHFEITNAAIGRLALAGGRGRTTPTST